MKKIKIITSVVIASSVFLFVIFGDCVKKFAEEKLLYNKSEKIVLSLWHTDTFEGGKGSRADYLLSVAAAFEKENGSVLIAVKSVDSKSLRENIENYGLPDMISFGNMGGISGLVGLNEGHDNLKYGDKFYGKVWCKGGYFLISRKESEDVHYKKVVFSKGKYNQPALAFSLEGFTTDSFIFKNPLEAYVEFLSDKDCVLLGTQRDVYRLISKDGGYYFKPLNVYNDLFQYISLCTSDKVKSFYAQKYIDYLVGEDGQKNLKKIAMMSYNKNVSQDIEELKASQEIKNKLSVSAFTDVSVLDAVNELSTSYLKGDGEALKKIKTLLI